MGNLGPNPSSVPAAQVPEAPVSSLLLVGGLGVLLLGAGRRRLA